MKTKTIPFDLETAKKIQAGEIEGKMYVSDDTHNKIRLICADRRSAFGKIVALEEDKIGMEWIVECNLNGEFLATMPSSEQYATTRCIVLEVPDNEQQKPQFNSPYSIEQLNKLKEYTEQLMEVNQGVIDDLNSMMQELRKTCNLSLKTEFKPFDKVLVRQSDKDDWRVAFYSHFNPEENIHVTAWLDWYQCIPYEGNEHLVGTTDKPKEK